MFRLAVFPPEIKIQKSFDELAIGKTTIVIAHRLTTIKNVDLNLNVEI